MDPTEIIYGTTLGFLAGFVLFYTFKPSQPYPKFLMDLFQYPWIFLFVMMIVLYIFYKDIRLGALLLLIFIMILLDSYFLGKDSL